MSVMVLNAFQMFSVMSCKMQRDFMHIYEENLLVTRPSVVRCIPKSEMLKNEKYMHLRVDELGLFC